MFKWVVFLNELMGEFIKGAGSGGKVLEGPLQLLRATTRRRREPQIPEMKLFKGIWWLRTFSQGAVWEPVLG